MTKIYHPGINEEGAICVPILRDQVRYYLPVVGARGWIGDPQWKPSITIATGEEWNSGLPLCMTIAVVLSVIQEKVNNPSADDPFEPEIAAVSGQSWGGEPGRG